MKRLMKIAYPVCLVFLTCSLMLTACDNKSVTNEEQQSALEETSNVSTAEKENETTASNNNTDDLNNSSSEITIEGKYNNALSLIAQEKNEEAYKLLNEIKTYAPAQETLKNFFYAPQTVLEKWKYHRDSDNEERTSTDRYNYDKSGNITEWILHDGTSYNFFYNEDGNIISGMDLIYGEHVTYTYKEGKLHQEISDGEIKTYYYNSDGLVSKISKGYDSDQEETTYEYTFYENGNVKTMKVRPSYVDDNEWIECTYNENGQLTKVSTNGSGMDSLAFVLTYGEFGLTKIVFQSDDELATFVYTYNSKGILIGMEANEYSEGKLDSTHIYTFEEHKLCYSENPATKDRLDIVYYIDLEATLEVIW